jgi:hypothetical protein
MQRLQGGFSYITASVTRALKSTLPALALTSTGCLQRPVTPAKPTTTNVYVGTIANRAVDKVDLLFMIDNSLSMADKQEILSQAVPVLVQRLVTPTCVDHSGRHTGVSDQNGHCASGSPEFNSVKDIHVGVITSSLGDHGGSGCQPTEDDVAQKRTPDDRAELLPTANPAVRGPMASWNGQGFLAWDPSGTKNVPAGEANLESLTNSFRDQVKKAGENGCGYEGSLEAWYRFLVDPEPPTNVTTARASATDPIIVTTRGPVNQTLLAQRKAFLRPDSLLSIVMLTDENDCSIVDDDGSQGWLASGGKLPRASAACAANPDDPCCHSCGVDAPEGCTANGEDAECSKGDGTHYPLLSPEEDSPNLRCFDQKRRFGMDLLYPTERYVNGLTQAKVPNRAGKLVDNPVFAAPEGMAPRSPSLVLLTGIVGVPWQDLANEESLTGRELTYLTAAELKAGKRWDLILGGKDGPGDPLMRESIAPRTGTNPLTGAALAPPTATGSTLAPPTTATGEVMNPINGHEQNVVRRDDLQYACTFPLPTERPCNETNADSCDCLAVDREYNRPLCEYRGGPTEDGVQVAAKAYPALRELAVLRGVGENGIVASICPKNIKAATGMTPEEDASYGYNPAIAAMAEIFKTRLTQQCLPRPLPVESDATSPDFGKVPCAVVEALPNAGGTCSCDTSHGRSPLAAADDKLPGAVRDQLALEGTCGGRTGKSCSSYCLCKLDALGGDALEACQNGDDDGTSFGYCYVDPEHGIGNPELVKACPATSKRSLHFVGEGLPAHGSITFMACEGATFQDDAD